MCCCCCFCFALCWYQGRPPQTTSANVKHSIFRHFHEDDTRTVSSYLGGRSNNIYFFKSNPFLCFAEPLSTQCLPQRVLFFIHVIILFLAQNQDRGVEKEPEYFPYRDDGRKIFDAIQAMVKDYVALWVLYRNFNQLKENHTPSLLYQCAATISAKAHRITPYPLLNVVSLRRSS